MKLLYAEQKGSILPMFAVVLVVVFMVSAAAVDFGRYVLAAEKLQAATDSAAFAAAMTAKRYVRLEINRGRYWSTCRDKEGKSRPCCKSCGETIVKEGPEEELLEKKGYKKYCCNCRCGSVKILDRWVEYEKNGAEARAAAELFFDINKPEEMDPGSGGNSYLSSVSIRDDKSDPLYPSVIVRSRGSIKTLMMDFMDKLYPGTGLDSLDATRCGQGGTFYYDLDGNWHRAAGEGCD